MAAAGQLRLGLDETSVAPERRTPVVPSVSSPFESASQARRTIGWRAPTVSPNRAILDGLATMRDRSRAAARNDGYGRGAIDHLVANIIGTGIKPVSQADDVAFRARVQDLWLRWTDESDTSQPQQPGSLPQHKRGPDRRPTGNAPPERPIFVIRAGARGDLTLGSGETRSPSIAWSRTGRGSYMPTPLIYGGLLYVLANNGVFDAYNLTTGDEIYRQRRP